MLLWHMIPLQHPGTIAKLIASREAQLQRVVLPPRPELPSGQIGIAKLLQHVNVVAAGEGGGIADLALAHGAA